MSIHPTRRLLTVLAAAATLALGACAQDAEIRVSESPAQVPTPVMTQDASTAPEETAAPDDVSASSAPSSPTPSSPTLSSPTPTATPKPKSACPRSFEETDGPEGAHTAEDVTAAIALLREPGKSVGCVYSHEHGQPLTTLGTWIRLGSGTHLKKKWNNEAPALDRLAASAQVGEQWETCESPFVDVRFVYARRSDAGTAYVVADAFACEYVRVVTDLGEGLTQTDVLVDHLDPSTREAVLELQARMAAG